MHDAMKGEEILAGYNLDWWNILNPILRGVEELHNVQYSAQ